MVNRTYRYITSKPLYPFGYGLSYTDFGFDNLHLDAEEITADGSLKVSVEVKNRGDFDAEEVVQLYVTVPDAEGNQPLWSLKNFERISLDKGASTTVIFKVDSEKLEQYNDAGKAEVKPGAYTLHIGNCSPGERGEELGGKVVSASFTIK